MWKGRSSARCKERAGCWSSSESATCNSRCRKRCLEGSRRAPGRYLICSTPTATNATPFHRKANWRKRSTIRPRSTRITSRCPASPWRGAETADDSLPVHFFTIVLNGRPFIGHHVHQFAKLPFRWHWHIVEGVADLRHDTAWSLPAGGRVPETGHRNGLSTDGTTEYLDDLARRFNGQVTVYRKTGAFWDGKLEMVNAPLPYIREKCLLWQVDADELWTAEQIARARDLFLAHPDRTAAYYVCRFFVGRDLVVTSRNTYGNRTGSEWLRTWRWEPGDRWISHEPPKLVRLTAAGAEQDLAANAFQLDETEAEGLVFQHYAYATEAQLQFKQSYYGYENAVAQWQLLQAVRRFPVRLADYFPWVEDEAEVNTVASQRFPTARSVALVRRCPCRRAAPAAQSGPGGQTHRIRQRHVPQ